MMQFCEECQWYEKELAQAELDEEPFIYRLERDFRIHQDMEHWAAVR